MGRVVWPRIIGLKMELVIIPCSLQGREAKPSSKSLIQQSENQNFMRTAVALYQLPGILLAVFALSARIAQQ